MLSVYVCSVIQLSPILCDPLDCSPPDSSVLGISQQEYWSGLPFPTPGNLPHPGIEITSLASPALCLIVLSILTDQDQGKVWCAIYVKELVSSCFNGYLSDPTYSLRLLGCCLANGKESQTAEDKRSEGERRGNHQTEHTHLIGYFPKFPSASSSFDEALRSCFQGLNVFQMDDRSSC